MVDSSRYLDWGEILLDISCSGGIIGIGRLECDSRLFVMEAGGFAEIFAYVDGSSEGEMSWFQKRLTGTPSIFILGSTPVVTSSCVRCVEGLPWMQAFA